MTSHSSSIKEICSVTRKGLSEIFAKLLRIAIEKRGYTGKDITSHDCTAMFQGKVWKNTPHWEGNSLNDPEKTWKEYPGWAVTKRLEALQFHPMEKFRNHYSDQAPTHTISYRWANLRLNTDANLYLDEFEKTDPPDAGTEATYWLDVLFIDQNRPGIDLSLATCGRLYAGADRHMAFVSSGMLSRSWCLFELLTRFLSALHALGLTAADGQHDADADAVLRGGELLRAGHPAFTAFVDCGALRLRALSGASDGPTPAKTRTAVGSASPAAPASLSEGR